MQQNDCSLNWKIMMKHLVESSHWNRIFPKVMPPPRSSALPTARHSSHGGTDRLTNKVNKYFPPLLKANQILIFEVWSAEKNIQQTVSGRLLIELIPSCSAQGRRRKRWRKEEEEGVAVSWNCRNSFQAENEQIFGYKRLKQFQFLIHLHVLVSLWEQLVRHMLSLLWVYVWLMTPTHSRSQTLHSHACKARLLCFYSLANKNCQ